MLADSVPFGHQAGWESTEPSTGDSNWACDGRLGQCRWLVQEAAGVAGLICSAVSQACGMTSGTSS